MTTAGKPYGQILFAAEQAYYAANAAEGSPLNHICDWEKCPTALAKAAKEAGAAAVIEEWRARNPNKAVSIRRMASAPFIFDEEDEEK